MSNSWWYGTHRKTKQSEWRFWRPTMYEAPPSPPIPIVTKRDRQIDRQKETESQRQIEAQRDRDRQTETDKQTEWWCNNNLFENRRGLGLPKAEEVSDLFSAEAEMTFQILESWGRVGVSSEVDLLFSLRLSSALGTRRRHWINNERNHDAW